MTTLINSLSVFDGIMLLLFVGICTYALDAINYQHVLKASNPNHALILYMVLVIVCATVVFTFYLYLKLIILNIIF